jgi:ferredoxin
MDAMTHLPLAGDRMLNFMATACLAVRGGVAACDRCAAACPVAALKVSSDGTALVGACLHCGRCAAACPSGALHAKGFDEAQLPSGNLPVTIECWKVPREIAGPQAIRVPCLGGIPTFRLLEWLLAAGERRLIFVDRGWCARCAAGGGAFPGAARLAETEPWLEACGLPLARRPKCKHDPLPGALMPADIPAADSQISMGRRAFFARLGKEIARSERPAEAPAGPRAALRRAACPLPARERWLAALAALAARHGRPLPERALPRLEVSPACRDHGLCAGLCPTGALSRKTDEARAQLVFAAAACIACGRCADACPERAIRLETSGGALQPVAVRTHEMRRCLECGREFPDRGEAICPACARGRSLARSLFGPKVAEG